MHRFYDKWNKYTEGILKEYDHWMLEVSYHQHTFGCYIIFCKQEKTEKISELANKELLELKQVMMEIEQALLDNTIFKPDRFNYWQMGNVTHQLHIHGIPRYASSRTFADRIWEDTTYGDIPIWSTTEETHETIRKFRKAMQF